MASAKKTVKQDPTQEVQTQEPQVQEVQKPKRNLGIGTYVKDKILNSNWTNKEILEDVQKQFPTAKTTYACIAWYRTHLRGLGQIPPRHAKPETTQEVSA